MTVWAAFGVAAGLLSCVEAVPYIRDVLRGTTRPHRGTWCIWSVLGLTALASQIASGGGWSLLMVGVTTAGVTIVFVLSMSRGVGGIAARDQILMALAAVGILGWLVSSQPIVATVCVVVADLAGVLLMMPKSWHDPHSETASSYVLAAIAGALGAIAVGSLDIDLLVYPVYFGAANAFTATVILLRRRSLATESTPAESGGVPFSRVN